MSRDRRAAAAVAFAVLALGLGAAACGGGGQSKEDKAAQVRAEHRWRSGLMGWSEDMGGAMNGISLLFSNPGSVDRLQRGNPRTMAQLARFERILSRCGATVIGLGPAPEALGPARKAALRACVSLERGAREVRTGIEDWKNGLTGVGINRASETLSTGQDGLARARVELKASTT